MPPRLWLSLLTQIRARLSRIVEGRTGYGGVAEKPGVEWVRMYRNVQSVRDDMVRMQSALRAGMLANTTEDISRHTSEAMVIVDEMLQTLGRAEAGPTDTVEMSEGRVNTQLVEAARRALTQAWDRAEAVAVGTSADEMRSRLLDFKTYADFADAYIAVALGTPL